MKTIITLLTALTVPTLVLAGDLAETEKKIIESVSKVKSAKADILMNTSMENPGMTMKSEGKGTFEFQVKDDKHLSRMELKNVMVATAGGQENKMEAETVTVTDGEYTYTVSEQFGQKMAFKQKVDPKQSAVASEQMFEELRKNYELKQLDDQKVNGKDAYVIEATPKSSGQSGKQHYYYSKENGMLLKMEAFTPDGKPMTTMEFKNLKVNVDIDPKRFVFEAPEGVPVQEVPQQ